LDKEDKSKNSPKATIVDLIFVLELLGNTHIVGLVTSRSILDTSDLLLKFSIII